MTTTTMHRKIAVPIAKAIALAEEHELDANVKKALTDANSLGYSVVDFDISWDQNGSATLGVSQQTGLNIMLTLPPEVGELVAIPGGEAVLDLHITVVYLGDVNEYTVPQQQAIIGIVTDVARDWKQMSGTLAGLGYFDPATDEDGNPEADAMIPIWVGVQMPGLFELRQTILNLLDGAEIPYGAQPEMFQPHITVAYIEQLETDEGETLDQALTELLAGVLVSPIQLNMNFLTAALGSAHYDAQFINDGWWGDEYWGDPPTGNGYLEGGSPSAYRPNLYKSVSKVDAEKFTLGAWYLPDKVDAHGDWANRADVKKAFYDYTSSGNTSIKLQHMPDIEAGKWVEAYIKEEAFSAPVMDPDTHQIVTQEFPAGTPFLGVKWEDWAWPLVENGDIRGLSMAGNAEVLEVDLGVEAMAIAKSLRKV